MKKLIFGFMIGALMARPVWHGTSWLDFFGQAMAENSLPMDVGLYVQDNWPCSGAPEAVKLYYTGSGINAIAQCEIRSVTGSSVELSCVDPQSYPKTRFTVFSKIVILGKQSFKYVDLGDESRYRWCSK